jgi:hypothetical protein
MGLWHWLVLGQLQRNQAAANRQAKRVTKQQAGIAARQSHEASARDRAALERHLTEIDVAQGRPPRQFARSLKARHVALDEEVLFEYSTAWRVGRVTATSPRVVTIDDGYRISGEWIVWARTDPGAGRERAEAERDRKTAEEERLHERRAYLRSPEGRREAAESRRRQKQTNLAILIAAGVIVGLLLSCCGLAVLLQLAGVTRPVTPLSEKMSKPVAPRTDRSTKPAR